MFETILEFIFYHLYGCVGIESAEMFLKGIKPSNTALVFKSIHNFKFDWVAVLDVVASETLCAVMESQDLVLVSRWVSRPIFAILGLEGFKSYLGHVGFWTSVGNWKMRLV